MSRLKRARQEVLIACLVCCCLVSLVLLTPAQAFAVQPLAPRLFHEPMYATDTDEQIENTSSAEAKSTSSEQWQKRHDNPATASTEPTTTKPDHTDRANSGKMSIYRYNGFISTEFGQHYLINGKPLRTIAALELVTVKHGGKSLVLKTRTGRTFKLSVGQSIKKGSL